MRNVNYAQVSNVVANVVVVDRQDRSVMVGMITVREHLHTFPRLHRPRFLEAGSGYWQGGLALKSKCSAAAASKPASRPGCDQTCHSTGLSSGGRRLPCFRSECRRG
jgi:hypothetical protein